MNDSTGSRFFANLPPALSVGDSYVEQLLLREYGGVFVARGAAVPPDRVVFADQREVLKFQNGLDRRRSVIDGLELELQAAAMDDLLKAIAEASQKGLSISPRGPDSAARDYDGTVELWRSRVEPALEHWTAEGAISADQAARIRSFTPFEQVSEVLELEKEGIWFAKDLSKSIIYSVAPPGTSQHLAMLAFDVAEFAQKAVREILYSHGWFQTVVSDLPHFTYLGVKEFEIEGLGLKRVNYNEQIFWMPDM